MKVGRNEPCHCGSGKKYKKCCLERDEADAATAVPVTAGSRRIADEANAAAARSLELKLKRADPEAQAKTVVDLATLFTDGPLADIRFDELEFIGLVEEETAAGIDRGDVEEDRERVFKAVEDRLVPRGFYREVRNRLNEVLAGPEATIDEREAAMLGLAGAEPGGPIARIVFEIQLDEMHEDQPKPTDALLEAAVIQLARSIEASTAAPVVDAVDALASGEVPAIFTADELLLAAALMTSLNADPEPLSALAPDADIKAVAEHLIGRLVERLRGALGKLESEPGWTEPIRARVLGLAIEAPPGDPLSVALKAIGDALPVAGGLLVFATLVSSNFLIHWRDEGESDAFGEPAMDALLDGVGLVELLRGYETHLQKAGEHDALSNVRRAKAILEAG